MQLTAQTTVILMDVRSVSTLPRPARPLAQAAAVGPAEEAAAKGAGTLSAASARVAMIADSRTDAVAIGAALAAPAAAPAPAAHPVGPGALLPAVALAHALAHHADAIERKPALSTTPVVLAKGGGYIHTVETRPTLSYSFFRSRTLSLSLSSFFHPPSLCPRHPATVL